MKKMGLTMSREKFDVPLAIVLTIICCFLSFCLILDYLKTVAVNQYLSGELKCVPDNFEPTKLVCRSSVGK